MMLNSVITQTLMLNMIQLTMAPKYLCQIFFIQDIHLWFTRRHPTFKSSLGGFVLIPLTESLLFNFRK